MLSTIFILIYILSVVVALVFFIFLKKQKKKPAAAIALMYLIASVAIWTCLQILSPLDIFSKEIHVFLWRATFIAASFVTLLLLRFVLEFNDLCKRRCFWIYRIIFWGVFIPFDIYFFLSEKLIKTNIIGREIWEVGYVEGDFYVFYALAIALPLIVSFGISITKYFKEKGRDERKVLRLITIGLCFPLFGGVLTNLVFPLLGINFPRLANLASIILIGFLYYVIYEYRAMNMNDKRYPIRFRLITAFLSVVFVSGIVSFSLFYGVVSNFLVESTSRELEITAEEKADNVEMFLAKQVELIEVIGISAKFSDFLNDSNDQDLFNYIVSKLSESRGDGFSELSLINGDGIVVASSNPSITGSDYSYVLGVGSGEHYYREIKQSMVRDLEYNNKTKENELIVFSDIKDSGRIVGKVKVENLYKILLEDGSDAESSDETYLVNREGKIISPLKTRSNAVLDEDSMAFSVFKNKSSLSKNTNIVSYIDYREEEVLGAIQYLPTMDWNLVRKIDKKEFLEKDLNKLSLFFFILILLMLSIALVFSYFFSRKFSIPMAKLLNGVRLVSRGNLDFKMEIATKDEFQELAQAFNQMSGELKNSYVSLEDKIQKRTRELQKALSFMDDSQKAMLNILEDVDEEKESLEEEKDRISAILQSIGDGVFVVDRDLNIIMFNQVASDLSGYDVNEAVGSNYRKILNFVFKDNGDGVDHDFIKSAIEEGKIKEMARHTILIKKDGQEIPVADSAAPVKNNKGEVVGCVVVFRDMTREEEIDKAKTEFVSLASHQLRTPLSSINWFAEMLLAGDAGEISAEQKDYLQEIYGSNQRMIDLVNSLLNVSRMELGTFIVEPEISNIPEMANKMLSELNPDIEKRQMTIEKDYEKDFPEISVDPKLMTIIFQNLLSNAVKYTPEKGKIKISIKKQDKRFTIEIADNGLGIPEYQKDKIFEKLFRADNVRQSDTEGTGLGLYLIKLIVDYTGGRIWFESKENKGTTFFVEMPLSGMAAKEGTKKLD